MEDYLANRPDLAYAQVPSVFGLGVVYPRSGEAGTRLAAVLAPYDRNPHLERVEQNRLVLWLRVVELQDQFRAEQEAAAPRQEHEARTVRSRVLVQYADRIAFAEADNAALRLELQRRPVHVPT